MSVQRRKRALRDHRSSSAARAFAAGRASNSRAAPARGGGMHFETFFWIAEWNTPERFPRFE